MKFYWYSIQINILPILLRNFNEPLTIEPRRIIEVKSNPVSKYININHDKLSVKGIIIKYATGEYVFCNFRYNGIFQWVRNKLNCHIWINKKQNRYVWLNKKLHRCTWINKIVKDFNEIQSIRKTFGDTVIIVLLNILLILPIMILIQVSVFIYYEMVH